jgi:hypothetical protein
MSNYTNMMLVVTAMCHDEYRTQIRLESPDLYNAHPSPIDGENPLQEVADFFEDKGITIDQGGDDNTIEFDLPDTFDNASSAARTANKVMKRLQAKLKKYMVVPPTVTPIVTPPSGPQPKFCTWNTKEEYCQYLQNLLDSGKIMQTYFDICMQPEFLSRFVSNPENNKE